MVTEELVDKLKEILSSQAKNFLEKFGEFFPFATAIGFNGEVIPIGVYFGEEMPLSEDVLRELEIALKKSKEEKAYLIVGICIDVLVTRVGRQDKIDALLLRIDGEQIQRVDIYIPYIKKDYQINFSEPYSEPGTLVIW